MFKKLLLIAFTAAPAFCLSAEEAAPSVYTSHYDWQFRSVETQDVDPGENVRHQDDFTKPLHGPWLLNPATDSATIGWITRRPCAVGVEYREKGTEEFKRVIHVKYGAVDYSKDLHAIHLAGLKPGTEYEYRLISNLGRHQTPYSNIIHIGREIYSFRTIEPEKKNYKVFLTADIHGSARLTLDPMIKNTGSENADFYFFLGDNVCGDANLRNARYYILSGFMDDVCRIWGKNKHTVVLRGNHDFRGEEMYVFGDIFARPDGETFQAFRQGSTLFICLDSMWEPVTRHAEGGLQAEQIKNYLKKQADWLKELKKSDDWKKSKFRVVFSHIGLFASESRYLQEYFLPILNDPTPEGRIHAHIVGHEHLYNRINPGTKEMRIATAFAPEKPGQYHDKMRRCPIPDGIVYTQITGNYTEGMTIDVTPDKLIIKSHVWDQVGGGLKDACEITPDGKVKDLVPVTVITPAPQKAKKK